MVYSWCRFTLDQDFLLRREGFLCDRAERGNWFCDMLILTLSMTHIRCSSLWGHLTNKVGIFCFRTLGLFHRLRHHLLDLDPALLALAACVCCFAASGTKDQSYPKRSLIRQRWGRGYLTPVSLLLSFPYILLTVRMWETQNLWYKR